MSDLIDREDLVNGIYSDAPKDVLAYIAKFPSAEPKVRTEMSLANEIIRCKDCRWWDKYGDYDGGYCMAAKHGYFSRHWEISIRRKYKGDFYCADAEPMVDK